MRTTKSISLLPEPAVYFPIANDRYSTRAGLTKFGADFGNKQLDQQLFQFDNTFPHYRANKLTAKENSIHDYVCSDTVEASTLSAITTFIARHLCHEHPKYFSLQVSSQNSILNCRLTGEQLRIHFEDKTPQASKSYYEDLFDKLASELQEDICVMQIKDSTATMVAAHLCAPNHWSARDKLGMDMETLHQFVPDFSNENREPNQLLIGLHNKSQAYVRFAWGLSKQPNLNQHPTLLHTDTSPHRKKSWMRIERQVIWPVINTDLVLFTIRTYFRDCATFNKQQQISLANAIDSMSDATLEYKNIKKDRDL